MGVVFSQNVGLAVEHNEKSKTFPSSDLSHRFFRVKLFLALLNFVAPVCKGHL